MNNILIKTKMSFVLKSNYLCVMTDFSYSFNGNVVINKLYTNNSSLKLGLISAYRLE